ncbi:hypothetical protein TREMEDRAFT_43910 [Tremella mesenterica DSM 1558]|uniref:uncharacterized protein n=1 Tax=Tremella mesenterica (strain ATCC 24925 / CBS 8224 / DSM 1558 / NBRC 9311 / NRRL Y-6157 / RJB 2259-6 / UBC 559-6) TaxID=578456 RepID=UPI0003F49A80|nr:uncharacterized protein TREMEDRAFT_43910 [Tremella mesenterica DSM 1558]EIW69324.1 hypothetical protein TREMEDRAFT_43910 [Tremella mesenterica DSM 1558]
MVYKPIRKEDLFFEQQYEPDIVDYMMRMDDLTLASADLMDMQPELQWFMRPYLIDFLIEVHTQFRLRPEVLYLTMNIVDRYVSKRVVYKKHYQLVGCAALWIAAKFEDGKDKVPLVRELAEMCCKAYDESAFIQMEGHVLATIGWVVGHPTAEAWLRVQASGDGRWQEEGKVQNMARFVMEVTLFHREFVGLQAEFVALGSLILARYICGRPYSPKMEVLAIRVAYAIDRQFAERLDSISEIIIRKYAPVYYSRSSTVAREWYLSGHRFHWGSLMPVTPTHSFHTPGLAPSSSWLSSLSGKRDSWLSGSPGALSTSCSSSEAGDEVPTTPITPVHANVVNPFDVRAKENVAPYSRQYPGKDPKLYRTAGQPTLAGHPPMGVQGTLGRPVHPLPTVHPHPRPPLHALPQPQPQAQAQGPALSTRRLSN